MKLILDQGLPRSAVQRLTALRVHASHVGDVGMAAAADDEILAFALRERATVVTFDADFHQLLANTGAELPSVIRIRIEGLKADRLVTLLMNVLQIAEADLLAGAVVSVTEGRIRMRKLPIR